MALMLVQTGARHQRSGRIDERVVDLLHGHLVMVMMRIRVSVAVQVRRKERLM